MGAVAVTSTAAEFMHSSLAAGQQLRAEIANPQILATLNAWLRIHPGSGLPNRLDFDPIDLPSHTLPSIFMLARDSEDEAFTFRLVGSQVADAFKCKLSGCQFTEEEIPGITASHTYRLLREQVEQGLPAHYTGPPAFRHRHDYTAHEQIVLPMCGGCTSGVRYVLGAVVYEGRPPAYGPVSRW